MCTSFLFHKAKRDYNRVKIESLFNGFYSPPLKKDMAETDENGAYIYTLIADLEQIILKGDKKYV